MSPELAELVLLMRSDLSRFWHRFQAFGHHFLKRLTVDCRGRPPFPITESHARRHERRHHVLLDLRFLLAILLRWMGRPATDSKRPRRGPAAMPGRIDCPENGSPLSLGMREKDDGASGFDLNRKELSHWKTNSWA